MSEKYAYFCDFFTLIMSFTAAILINYAFLLYFFSIWVYRFGRVIICIIGWFICVYAIFVAYFTTAL